MTRRIGHPALTVDGYGPSSILEPADRWQKNDAFHRRNGDV